MKNLWVQQEDAIAVWIGDVTAAVDEPNSLLSLVSSVYRLGEELELLLSERVPLIAEAHRLWNDEHKLDVFRLLSVTRTSARLAWYDGRDSLAGGLVADLGVLLASLEPSPGSIPKDVREIGESPLSFGGTQLQYKAGKLIEAHRFSVQFSLSIHSDIWMPYVLGMAHPNCDHEHFFDNRELATRNSKRLNELIMALSRSVRDLGGTWILDEDACMKAYLPWLSVAGVELHREPRLLQPATALAATWVKREQS